MKVLVVFALFVALVAAIPMPSEEIKPEDQPQPEQQKQDALLSADANPQADNSNADRSKRFIFFSKILYPYPVTYSYETPVVTQVVQPETRTKIVESAPVTYQVKPVTYQYTYSVPSYTIVRTEPIVKTVSVETAAPAESAQKTESDTVNDDNDDDDDDEE